MIPIPNARVICTQEAVKNLSLPCYLILSGSAQPYFPTTTPFRPSVSVVVIPVGSQATGLGLLPSSVLPIAVDGEQWRRCVVPVLKLDTLTPENPATWSLPREEIINLIGRALGASFAAAGYGPQAAG
jgi:hypothetical protein